VSRAAAPAPDRLIAGHSGRAVAGRGGGL